MDIYQLLPRCQAGGQSPCFAWFRAIKCSVVKALCLMMMLNMSAATFAHNGATVSISDAFEQNSVFCTSDGFLRLSEVGGSESLHSAAYNSGSNDVSRDSTSASTGDIVFSDLRALKHCQWCLLEDDHYTVSSSVSWLELPFVSDDAPTAFDLEPPSFFVLFGALARAPPVRF